MTINILYGRETIANTLLITTNMRRKSKGHLSVIVGRLLKGGELANSTNSLKSRYAYLVSTCSYVLKYCERGGTNNKGRNHSLLLYEQAHDKRGIALSLHASICKARLLTDLYVRWTHFQKSYRSKIRPSPL